MRITSLLMALAIVGGLYYWFVERHRGLPAGPEIAEVDRADGSPVTTLSTDAVADAAKRATPIPVTVLTSTARPTETTLTVHGRTEANRNIRVAAETTGRVSSPPLRRGATVAAGAVLCRLDPGVREAELAEAQASLAEAMIEAEAASALQKKGFTAETTMRARTARLQAAQARLDRVTWDISQLEIHAPFDGVLETDTAELGTLLRPGDICANVIDLGTIKVSGFVAENEVDLLRIGQPAVARLVNGMRAEGRISFLSRVADERTRTFEVEVTIDNPDTLIRDGMTAELQIELPSEDGHLLPQTALTLNDDGALGVRIDDGGIARFVPVRILTDAPDGVWVAGLPDTVDVIVVGQEFVREGSQIEAFSIDWKSVVR